MKGENMSIAISIKPKKPGLSTTYTSVTVHRDTYKKLMALKDRSGRSFPEIIEILVSQAKVK